MLLWFDDDILWIIRIWSILLDMVSTDYFIRPQGVITQYNRGRLNSSFFLISDFLLKMAGLVTLVSLFLQTSQPAIQTFTKVTSCVLVSFTPGPPGPTSHWPATGPPGPSSSSPPHPLPISPCLSSSNSSPREFSIVDENTIDPSPKLNSDVDKL